MNSINRLFDKLDDNRVKTTFLFILLGLALFSASLTYPFFVFDDYANIQGNPHVPPRSIGDFLFYWMDSNTPLAYNTWQVLSLFFGADSATPFRFFNILVHSMNASFIFFISRKLFSVIRTRQKLETLAWIASLIFLFHPTQVESVVWASSGRGLFSTFFFLLALLTYINDRNEKQFNIKCFVLFIIATLVKPSALVFPAFIFLIERFFYQKTTKQFFKENHFYIYPALGLAIIHIKDLLTIDLLQLPYLVRWVNIVDSFHHYLIKSLAPINLAFNYQLSPFSVTPKDLSTPKIIFCAATTLITLFVFIRSLVAKKLHFISFFICLFFISIFPTLGFFPFDFQNISTVSDRYHYLAILPFAWFVILAFEKIKFRSLLPFISAFILIFCLQASFWRVIQWSSSEQILLADRPVEQLPEVLLAPLVRVWSSQGKCDEIYQVSKIQKFKDFTTRSSDYVWPFFTCLKKSGDQRLASSYSENNVVQSDSSETLLLVAEVYLKLGLFNEFYESARQAYLADPNNLPIINSYMEDAKIEFKPALKKLYGSILDYYLINRNFDAAHDFIQLNTRFFYGEYSDIKQHLDKKADTFKFLND